ncbi:MAG TPA: hypothetical protein VHA73_01685 [Acidimicrobiales bacterium]|nr:hypothetical protein [Acidimicrobiales bacterium]
MSHDVQVALHGGVPGADAGGPVRRARPVLLALLAVALILLAGCQATADVTVKVKNDGSGEIEVVVRVDAAAAKRLPPPAGLLSVADLRRAGWTVAGPTVGPDGSFSATVSHHFASLIDGNRLLAELSGPEGPLRDLHMSRHVSLTSTRWRLDGTVDLSKGVDALGDPTLTAALGNRTLSSLLPSLQRPGDGPLSSAVRVSVQADLPGHPSDSSTPVGAGLGQRAQTFQFTSKRSNGIAPWLLLAAAVALVGLLLATWWAVRGFRRDRRARRGASGSSRATNGRGKRGRHARGRRKARNR